MLSKSVVSCLIEIPLNSMEVQTSTRLLGAVNPHQADVSESLTGGGGQICPTKEIGYIVYFFAFYATKMGPRDSEDTKGNPHWF